MRKTSNHHWPLLLAALLMLSCASQRRVATESRTQVVHVHDTVHIADTVVSTTETVVCEADSALLDRYGILQSRPGASWIIRQTSNTYRAVSSSVVRDRDSTRVDTVYVSVPRGKSAETSRTPWLTSAIPVVLCAAIFCAIWAMRKK